MAIKVSGAEVISDDKRILNNESLPDIRPSLLLDFANSKTLDPRITFTRGSTATYWDGKTTAKAEENLLKYSQDFTNTWLPGNVTVTGNNATAPDGTASADKIQAGTNTNQFYFVYQLVAAQVSTVYTATIYLKAGTNDYARFDVQQRNNGSYVDTAAYIGVNLTNGATIVSGGSGGSKTFTVTDVGSGWYRATATFTSSASGFNQLEVEALIATSSGDTQHSISGSKDIFVWGAQLEQRSSATAYTPTTTAPVVKYQPVLQTAASGEARFDHDPVTGESKGLLIEEARTNLSANSVPVTGWSVNTDVELMGYAAAPDGTLTAPYYMQVGTGSDASNNNTDIFMTPSASTNYVISCFIKQAPDGYDKAHFYNFFSGNSTKGSRFEYTFSTDTISVYEADGGGVVPFNYGREFVGNGWVRVWYVVNDANNGLNGILGTRFYAGGRDVNNYQGLIVWGFQIEVGSFPTSYIPTSGSTVTRAAESSEITGTNFSSWYTQGVGTLYAEVDHFYTSANDLFPRSVSLYGDDANIDMIGFSCANLPSMPYYTFGGNIFYGGTASIDTAVLTSNSKITGYHKSALAYTLDDFAITSDGISPATDATGVVPYMTNLTMFGAGSYQPANSGYIKKIAYYPKRLPNATLQAMTEA